MPYHELYEAFRECLLAENRYVHVENRASYCMKQSGRTLTLLFQKSNGLTDWINNFDFLPRSQSNVYQCCKAVLCGLSLPATPYRHMENSVRWKCHRGFLRVWKSIEPYVADTVRNPQVSSIRIIGYSHGAAIAQLCYEYVRFHRPDVCVVGYGFGAPRVVWGRPSQEVAERFEGFVAVRNGKDLVTYMPPRLVGFRHVGRLITLNRENSRGLIKDHYPEAYMMALRGAREEEFQRKD